jgi:hypothetical protein
LEGLVAEKEGKVTRLFDLELFYKLQVTAFAIPGGEMQAIVITNTITTTQWCTNLGTPTCANSPCQEDAETSETWFKI